jgi:hypothetical protein
MVAELKCFICNTPISARRQFDMMSGLEPEILDHIGKVEHIERKKEIELEIKTVPEGAVSVLQHWRQSVDCEVGAIVWDWPMHCL